MGKHISGPSRTSPLVRVSYPQIFVPSKKYKTRSVALMISKDNKELMAFMKMLFADAQKVLAEHWPDKASRPRIPVAGHDKSPIKDADKNSNDMGVPMVEADPAYAGHWIIRPSRREEQSMPIAVDENMQEILSGHKIYGGCFCKVNLNAYTYENENKGVTFGLNGIQFIKEGVAFGEGKQSAADMFGKEEGGSSEDYESDDTPF